MYGETGAVMRETFAELLRQHRVQQRLGGTPTERADVGAQIRQYRQTVLVWSGQALESVSPLAFSNQRAAQPNPFRSVGNSGPAASPAGELARAINLATTEATATPASMEQLTTPAAHESAELWRKAARAAALAEHDTAPDVATAMTVPQAHAVVADVAAITQALVVLDRRYRNTPGWEQLAQCGRLGWAALAAALDVSLGQPDYTVDTLGWRPKTKPITGPALPGIRGVLQAEHNLVVRLKTPPSVTNLRYVVDSQRLLTRHLLPFAERTHPQIASRWADRADTYVALQRKLRSIRGLVGRGGLAAAEGANAVSRIRALPADTIVEPRILGGFQTLFDRLDQRIADLIEDGLAAGTLVQRVALPRLDTTGGGLVAPVRERCTVIDGAAREELAELVRHALRPATSVERTGPGSSRATLHTALFDQPAVRERAVVRGL